MNKMDLKALITEMVAEETKKIAMGGAYRYKEELMKNVQDGLIAKMDNINSQEELFAEIESEIEKVKIDVEMTLDMIKKTISAIPLQVLKQLKQ